MTVNFVGSGLDRFYVDTSIGLQHFFGLSTTENQAARRQGRKKLMELVEEEARLKGCEHLNESQKIAMSLGADIQAAAPYGSSASIGNITSDIQNKVFREAYQNARVTYPLWCSRAEPVKDFKPIFSVMFDEGEDLEHRAEKHEIAEGTIVDTSESYVVAEFSKKLVLSEAMLRNDDRNALSKLPRKYAMAARRTENKLCVLELIQNLSLSDGKALFHADHNNLISPGSPPSRTAIKEMRRMLRVQTGLKSEAVLSYRLGVLLVPAALEDDADELVPPIVDPEQRPYKTRVVAEPLLDAVSESDYYGFTDPDEAAAIEYCHMRGHEEPTFDTWYDNETHSRMTSVSTIFGVKAVNHRPVVRNEGGS